MSRSFSLILLLTFVSWTTQLNANGSRIDEISAVANTIYVDVNNQGTEDGSATNPWNTIGEALDYLNLSANRGSSARIFIANGTYREGRLNLNLRTNVNAVTVFEGESQGGVIVSGSEIWTDWTADGNGNWYKPWTNDWGLVNQVYNAQGNPELTDLGRRMEMVFADGELLRQVDSYDELAANQDGTYFVDEITDGDTTDDRIYVRPPWGEDPNHLTIEVSVWHNLLLIFASDNIVLRNLIFQHAASGYPDYPDTYSVFLHGDAASFGNEPNKNYMLNLLVENCEFRLNNSSGLTMANAQHITFRNTKFNHNGSGGHGPVSCNNIVYENCDLSFNNWRRGMLGGMFGWAPAGTKVVRSNQVLFDNTRLVGNYAAGLWFDIYNTNLYVNQTSIIHNYSHGLYYEINTGPLMTVNSLIRNNGRVLDTFRYLGVYFAESVDFDIFNSYIVDNSYFGISFRNVVTRTVDSFWDETKLDQGIAERLTLQDSVVVATRDYKDAFGSDEGRRNGNVIGAHSDSSIKYYTNNSVPTYTGDHNHFYSPWTENVFSQAILTGFGFDDSNLAYWQALTGQDQNSIWDPDYMDHMDFDAFQESSGLVVMEAENTHSKSRGTDDEDGEYIIKNRFDEDGFSGHAGWGYLTTANNGVSATVDATAGSANMTYRVNISTPGTYYMALRTMAFSGNDDSIHVFVNGTEITGGSRFANTSTRWTWFRDTVSLGNLDTGIHTIKLARREDGFFIDRIAIADSLAKLPVNGSTDRGPKESPLGAPPEAVVLVSVDTDNVSVDEDIGSVTYRLYRTSNNGSLTVNYTMGGTATGGSDYTAPSGSVTIPDGTSFVDFDFEIHDDTDFEPDETIVLNITPNASYAIRSITDKTITLRNNDPAPPSAEAIHTSGRSIELNWPDLTNESHFSLWIRVSGNSEWTLVDRDVPADSTTYQIDGLTRGITYDFMVEALDNQTLITNYQTQQTLREGFEQTPELPNLIVIEAEDYTNTGTNGASDAWSLTTAFSGYSGDGAMQVSPDDGDVYGGGGTFTENNAPFLTFDVDFSTSGTHYLFVYCREPNGSNAGDSLHAGINGVQSSTAAIIEHPLDNQGIGTSFVWAAKVRDGSRTTLEIPSPGTHTIYLWAREDGIIVDKILLTTNSDYVPTGSEPFSCSRPAGDLNALEYWRNANWDITTDSGLAANTADPDQDQIANLLEFAFGLNANVPDIEQNTNALQLVKHEGQEYIEFSMRRRLGASTGTTETAYIVDGISYIIEVSPSLGDPDWQTGTLKLQQIDDPIYNGDGTETVTMRLLDSMVTTDKLFVRVRIKEE